MDGQHTARNDEPGAAGWRTLGDAVRVAVHPPHLKRALSTALIVGVILFALNQLDVVLSDGWSARVVAKTALNFVVPFCVAMVGILSATKNPGSRDRGRDGGEPGAG
jgi:hypothetical protein